MARTAEGWKLKWRSGVAHVRFTHAKKRYELTTGEKDPRRAAERAAEIYADVVSGRWKPVTHGPSSHADLDVIFADWLASLESTHDVQTVRWRVQQVRACFIPFFKNFKNITTATCADYARHRLTLVGRETVTKELSGLRTFLAWCVEQSVIRDAPVVRSVSPKSVGKRNPLRKTEATPISQAEAEAWLAALPEWSMRAVKGKKFAVRARFIVAWETGLRPETINTLSSPANYRKGATKLTITVTTDKQRFARPVPLTVAARAALDSVCPEKGVIFGEHDFRDYIPAAAKKAGLDPAKVETFTAYDLRHGRAVDLLETSGNLPGVAYLLGHKHLTTTNKYLKPGQMAAERALFGGLSGAAYEAEAVRRRGLEPLRVTPPAPEGGAESESGRNRGPGLGKAKRKGAARVGEQPDSGAPPQMIEAAGYLALLRVQEDSFDAMWAESLGIRAAAVARGAL